MFPLPQKRAYPQKALDKPVLFHAPNKTGSLALATCLRESYAYAGKQDQFISRYFGAPNTIDEAETLFRGRGDGHVVWLDHDLVRYRAKFPQAVYATILRSPTKRMISCYYWLRDKHPAAIGGRDLVQWVRESGCAYSLCFQFACGHPAGSDEWKKMLAASPRDIQQSAIEWFEENVGTYAIADLFEESIFLLASAFGLSSVSKWDADKRNTGRPRWCNIPERTIDDIRDIMLYDVEFYERMRDAFLVQARSFKYEQEFLNYKSACHDTSIIQASYGA